MHQQEGGYVKRPLTICYQVVLTSNILRPIVDASAQYTTLA